MIPLIAAFLKGKFFKIIIVIALFAAIAAGMTYMAKWHNDKLKEATQAGIDSVVIEQNEEIIRSFEQQLEQQIMEKAELNARLKQSWNRIGELEKQLLIEHDLDRLLQAKPGLILDRVNKGTGAVFDEVEGVVNE